MKIPVDVQDGHKLTPLHYAATHGHVAAFDVLMNHNANVALVDDYQRFPLHYAAFSGNAAMTERLASAKGKFGKPLSI